MSEDQNQGYPYYYYPQASPAYYPAYDSRQYQAPQFQYQQGTPFQAGQPQYQGNPYQGVDPAQDEPDGVLPMEQSYIENILRLNLGKMATIYMTFENNQEWNAKVFKGIVEAAGRDHIILSDPQTNKRFLLLMVYLDYITFEGELDYNYPIGTAQINR
ncbi:spore coat protein GerQ [Virgibacillus sp. DJP39]|uniref:spore coat protein GerQ n=1 Tax=Virgibacillus sp. DJP39 TaxID=3409790 RepID=UPI003BB69E0C